jgi:hypothetical protein
MLIENDAYLLQLSYYIHRNPLRARIVKRLASHRWSSYQVYAYGKSSARWLSTDLILSQFVNVEDPHKAYRQSAQKYATEEQRFGKICATGFFWAPKNSFKILKSNIFSAHPIRKYPSKSSWTKTLIQRQFF